MMKKRILIIGNTNGLPGVNVDVINYKEFFKSSMGGNWLDDEIEVLLNPSKIILEIHLRILKTMILDYLIIIFSGHGGQERELVLEINSQNEQIEESELKNIASRQLNIYDCCRCVSDALEKGLKADMLNEFKLYSTINTRAKYESRILAATYQQVYLYSCSIGEISNDTIKGGIYSKNLIEIGKRNSAEYLSIGSAHQSAMQKTIAESILLGQGMVQIPDAILPKCLSSQQLIWAINP